MTAVLFGVFAALCWSAHDLIARVYAPRIGPMRMGLWIMALSAIMLTAIVLWRGTVFAANITGFVWALVLGLAYACGGAGIYKAFSLGPISIVGPLTSAYPVLVVMWGLLNGLTPTLLQWLAMASALMGALIVSRSGEPGGGINTVLPGKLPALLLACLVCSLGYAVAVVIGQRTAVMIGEIEATWLSRATTIVAFLFLVTLEPRAESVAGHFWWGLAAMGGLDALGLIAVNASGHIPGKEFAAVGISAYGAMAVILAAFVLKEKVSKAQAFGIALIAGGVGVLALPQ
jgi:drug/metabolite transporter (DMT)-like permease